MISTSREWLHGGGEPTFANLKTNGKVAPKAVWSPVSYDGGRLSNAKRGQMTVGMREIRRRQLLILRVNRRCRQRQF
jgi:hypothetical protein